MKTQYESPKIDLTNTMYYSELLAASGNSGDSGLDGDDTHEEVVDPGEQLSKPNKLWNDWEHADDTAK